MALQVGSRIAHYDVTALIGEGGMGQVYQATDTKLNRQVALKILPEAFATDPDRLARFQREAQVLASLNHPNIAQIHGIEEEDGTRALVLELVEGQTLAERIKQGPIPIDEALPIAKQIAEALEAAHEAGVIHRDLKPANIKVREDGTVKVLDFGLAKALDTRPQGDPSESPTLTAAATQMGVIMGTAAYMSPEQASGKPADERSDLWSFGVVLFEMLTGRRLFDGETVSHVIAQVLERRIDYTSVQERMPPPVLRLLRRCLEREQRRRLKDPTEACVMLDEAREGDEGQTTAGRPTAWSLSGSAGFAGATMLAGAVIAAAFVWTAIRPDPPRVTRFVVTPDDGAPLRITMSSADLALSPDGSRVAFLAGQEGPGAGRLYVRSLDRLTSDVLVGEEVAAVGPFFSPDGQAVGFYDVEGGSRLLKRVPVGGGPVTTICELPGPLRGASWGRDGYIVFGAGSGLWRVAASGGEPELLANRDPTLDERSYRWPEVLPDGDSVLVTLRTSRDLQIAALSLETREHTVLMNGLYARYSPSGHLVYAADGDLWVVPFDLRRLEISGDPILVLEGVLSKELNQIFGVGGTGAANFALSADGTLIYMVAPDEEGPRRTMVWVDRTGDEGPIGIPAAAFESPRISPDGRHVAVEVRAPGNRDVMVYDLERGTATRLTNDPALDAYPVWLATGERVLFSSTRDGPFNLYSRAADGTGPVDRVAMSDAVQWPQAVSPDGGSLVIGYTPDYINYDVHLLSLDSSEPAESLVQTASREFMSDLSPNGRWIAYASEESGQWEVYVQPFPDVTGGRRTTVSRDGGWAPVWSASGRELFYRRHGTWEMMVVPVETDPTFSLGVPEVLFEAPYLVADDNQGRTRTWGRRS